MLSTDPT
jgi:hypothetical protein